MKYLQHFLLAMLMSGLMVIPGVAQSSGSNQPNPQNGNGQYASGNTGAESNKESSGNFATENGKGMSDQQFIKKAAQDDMAEVKIAQLAQQKASDNNVKQMAQHMLNDHQQNEQQIKQIAQKDNVTLPTQPDQKDKAMYDRLSKLNGPEFDKAFIREQIRDHKHDVAMFQREQSNAKDQNVKQYAQQTLPTLQQHLQMVEQTGQQLGVSSGNSGGHHHQAANNNNNQQSMK